MWVIARSVGLPTGSEQEGVSNYEQLWELSGSELPEGHSASKKSLLWCGACMDHSALGTSLRHGMLPSMNKSPRVHHYFRLSLHSSPVLPPHESLSLYAGCCFLDISVMGSELQSHLHRAVYGHLPQWPLDAEA